MFFPLGIWQGWSDRSNLEEGEEEKKASLKENKEVEYRKKNPKTKQREIREGRWGKTEKSRDTKNCFLKIRIKKSLRET